MRTSLLWTKFLFSDKIEKYILVHVMIKLIKWDGTLSDEANFLLLYIYISCEVNNFSTLTVESTPRPVRALNLFTELYAANIQRCRQMSDFKKKGISINFIGIKLLNLSKDV